MSASAIRGGRVAIEIGADISRFTKSLDAMQSRIRALGSTLSGIGTRLVGLGVGGAVPFAAAIKATADFEDAMASVAAVSGATGDEMATLSQRARDLGASTSFTAQQVAEGMGVLAQGGFTATETIGAIEGVLNLARSGMMDLAGATDIAVSTLRAFQMPAEQAGTVADILAKASSASNATISDLGESLSVVGGIAAGVGTSLEEVSAMLGVLADRGQKGSVAGTGLRRIFTALASEGDKLKDLGVEIKDPNTGKLRPVLDIIDDLKTALAGMDDVTKLEKLSSIFDVFGANAVFNLMNAGDAARNMLGQLQNSAGTAGQVAKMMDDTLGGSFRMAASAAEAVALEIGGALSPALRGILGSFAALAAGTADWISRNKEVAVSIATWVAATAAAGAALISMGVALKVVAVAVGGLSAGFSTLIAPIKLVASTAGLLSKSTTAFAGFAGSIGSSLARATVGMAAFVAQTAAMSVSYAAGLVAIVASTTATAVAVGAAWAGAAVTQMAAWLAAVKANITYYTGLLGSMVAITIQRVGAIAGAWIAQAGAGIARFVQATVVAGASYVAQLAAMVSTTVASAASMAAAWIAPVAPILAVGAAIAGIGIALTRSMGSGGGIAKTLGSMFEPLKAGFQGVLADATVVFNDLWQTASTTISGISDAIAAGNFGLAFEIAWSGIKAAWLRGQQALMSYIDPFIEGLQNVWGSMTASLASGIAQGLGLAEKTWIAFTGGLVTAWTFAVNKVLDVWDTTIGAIQKAIAYIRSFFDESIDYDAIKKQIDAANAQRKKDRDQVLRDRNADAADRQAEVDRRTEETVRIIVEDERKAQADRAQRTFDRAQAREEQVQVVLKELETNRGRAAGEREGADLLRAVQQADTTDELRAIVDRAQQLSESGALSDDLLRRIVDAVDDQTLEVDKARAIAGQEADRQRRAEAQANNAAQQVSQEVAKGDVAGTFSSDAVRGLAFSSNLAERTARATEETARNTRNIGGAAQGAVQQ